MSKKIEAVILDKRGYELERSEFDSVKAAKDRIKVVLSDEWAVSAESSHADLGTDKGEVRVDGECVWDAFYRPARKVPKL